MQIPFLGAEAIAAGELTPSALRRSYRAIYRGVYVPRGHQLALRDRLRGLMLIAPDAVITGVAASAVHGAKWVDPDTPIEVVSAARTQAGLIRRRETLHPARSPWWPVSESPPWPAQPSTSPAIALATAPWHAWMP